MGRKIRGSTLLALFLQTRPLILTVTGSPGYPPLQGGLQMLPAKPLPASRQITLPLTVFSASLIKHMGF